MCTVEVPFLLNYCQQLYWTLIWVVDTRLPRPPQKAYADSNSDHLATVLGTMVGYSV